MTIPVREFAEIIAEFLEEKGAKDTVYHSAAGGLVAGLTTFLGGLLLGPGGLLAGAAIGGIAAAFATQDKFEPLPSVIRNMTYEQKMELRSKIEEALNKINIYDLAMIGSLLWNQPSIQELVLREVGQFTSQELNRRMQHGLK